MFSAIMLVFAILCFLLVVFGGAIGELNLIALGLAFFAASFFQIPSRNQ